MILKNRQDIESLKIGQKIYKVTTNIDSYYYAGFSPIESSLGIQNHIMLIYGYNVSKMCTLYLPNINHAIWCSEYQECAIHMYKENIKRIESIKKIYLKNWTKSEWRDFNIENMLGEQSTENSGESVKAVKV